LDELGHSEITTDPIGTVDALSYDDSALVHDSDDAAGGKAIDPQCVLEMLEPGSNGHDGLQSTGPIVNGSRDVDDPFSGRASHVHVSNCETLAGKYLAEIWLVSNIDTCARSFPGCPDIVAIKGKHHDVVEEARQLGPRSPQQRVIGACVAWVCRYCQAEPS
jgi:hypothetical protein